MESMKRFLAGLTAVCTVLGAYTATAHAQVSLRVASEEPFSNPPRLAAQFGLEHLRDNVPRLTGNAVSIQLYPGAALGSEKELIRSVGSGIIDATVMSPGNAGSLIPEVQLFSASYLFTNYAHAKRVLTNDAFFNRLHKIIADKKLGFQLAGLSLTGTRNLYSRTRAVDSLESLKGIKMRVMNSPTEYKVWSTLGTLPSAIPGPEIYSALQTGVVDAAESSLPAIASGKYYEVAPNITLTHHQFNLHIYLVGDRALAKVPEAARPGFLKAFREAAEHQLDAAIRLADQTLAHLRQQSNVKVIEIDTKPLAERLRPIQDEVAANLKVTDVLEMIRSMQ
ncbi:MAG TPA: TRAP transporter substrate-binding protein [Alphaproteobacteria bacterium]